MRRDSSQDADSPALPPLEREPMERPRIIVMDRNDVAAALRTRGYNVQTGTYGRAFKVEASTGFAHVPSGLRAPGLTEQDVIVVDVAGPDKSDEAPEGDRPGPGVPSRWCPTRYGFVDPRPAAMQGVAEFVDRIHGHGGALIVITAARTIAPYVTGEIEEGPYRSGLTRQRDAAASNWDFARAVAPISAEADFGREINPTDLAVRIGLGAPMWQGRFTCTISVSGYAEDRFVPLATNKFGVPVAGLLSPRKDTDEGWVFLLPELERIDEVVLEIIDSLLPRVSPGLFPHSDNAAWTEEPPYEHPEVVELKARIDAIRARAEADELALESQIDETRKDRRHLHDLLTATDDELVAAVIATLQELGFDDVSDVDAGQKVAGDLREDIHIRDPQRPAILGEVKGIAGMPKEASSLQVVKYLAPRMREWKTTELRGLTIINHQRQFAPLQRVRAEHVFQDDVITTAQNQQVTLMTTWELFRIARNARRLGWTHSDVASLFYIDGRPDVVPAHYQAIGKVDACWPRASAFAASLSAPLRVGDRLAIETPVDFIEVEAVSLQLDDVSVDHAASGDHAGVGVGGEVQVSWKGARLFRVERQGGA